MEFRFACLSLFYKYVAPPEQLLLHFNVECACQKSHRDLIFVVL